MLQRSCIHIYGGSMSPDDSKRHRVRRPPRRPKRRKNRIVSLPAHCLLTALRRRHLRRPTVPRRPALYAARYLRTWRRKTRKRSTWRILKGRVQNIIYDGYRYDFLLYRGVAAPQANVRLGGVVQARLLSRAAIDMLRRQIGICLWLAGCEIRHLERR